MHQVRNRGCLLAATYILSKLVTNEQYFGLSFDGDEKNRNFLRRKTAVTTKDFGFGLEERVQSNVGTVVQLHLCIRHR